MNINKNIPFKIIFHQATMYNKHITVICALNGLFFHWQLFRKLKLIQSPYLLQYRVGNFATVTIIRSDLLKKEIKFQKKSTNNNSSQSNHYLSDTVVIGNR